MLNLCNIYKRGIIQCNKETGGRMKILEINKNNWEEYKFQMLNLENKVKKDMVYSGIGDLFFTTGEEIKDYVDDPRHHVYVMIDGKNRVLAQTYIIGAGSHIQGDYADLPKYFTMNNDFINYLKTNKFDNEEEYKDICNKMYYIKLCAFKYALKKIYGIVDIDKFINDLNQERQSSTHFDERTPLRRNINKYMTEFMRTHGLEEIYREFYNIDGIYNEEQELSNAYSKFIEASKVKIFNTKIQNPEEYYSSNVYNTIEVDTYITDPESRKKGLAKILSTLALSKTISEYFENTDNDILYLSITLHRDNYLSENIAHFLGFEDYIDLERRSNIERKAYLKRINRCEYMEYISNLHKKLFYFYNYGEENITDDEKKSFEIEKNIHNENIVVEINQRLKEETFSDNIRLFIENFRDNIIKSEPKILNLKKI